MLHVYVNYPSARFRAHQRPTCGFLLQHHKPNQRTLTITAANVEAELQNFRAIRYRFGASAEHGDMWLNIDLHSYDDEVAVATQIGQLLAQHYKQLKDIQLSVHCLSLEELRRQAGRASQS